jgi:hypothetical protein
VAAAHWLDSEVLRSELEFAFPYGVQTGSEACLFPGRDCHRPLLSPRLRTDGAVSADLHSPLLYCGLTNF